MSNENGKADPVALKIDRERYRKILSQATLEKRKRLFDGTEETPERPQETPSESQKRSEEKEDDVESHTCSLREGGLASVC